MVDAQEGVKDKDGKRAQVSIYRSFRPNTTSVLIKDVYMHYETYAHFSHIVSLVWAILIYGGLFYSVPIVLLSHRM